ncbi:MAG: hypothetical protein JWO83_522 [Caulobacteraceae bacterium]|nr:hypothetical protein [Caulobacteraceae bacterium]
MTMAVQDIAPTKTAPRRGVAATVSNPDLGKRLLWPLERLLQRIDKTEIHPRLLSVYTIESDIRRQRLLLRRRSYEEEALDCFEKVEAGMKSGDLGERRLWEPAARLLDELRVRLDEALSQAQDDPVHPTAEAAA